MRVLLGQKIEKTKGIKRNLEEKTNQNPTSQPKQKSGRNLPERNKPSIISQKIEDEATSRLLTVSSTFLFQKNFARVFFCKRFQYKG